MTDHPHIITILPDIADNRAEWEVKPHQPTKILPDIADNRAEWEVKLHQPTTYSTNLRLSPWILSNINQYLI